MRKNSKAAVFLLVCSMGWLGLPSSAVAGVEWNRLVFGAMHEAGSVTVTIELAAADDSELHAPAAGRGEALMPERGKLQRLTADVRFAPPGDESWFGKLPFLSNKQWLGKVWLLEDGAALQRTRLKPGRKGNFRRYRYTSEGVARRRFEPKNRRQSELPPEQWGKIKDKFFPFGPAAADCAPLIDAFALIYPLSASGPKADEGTELCVFNKKGLYRVRLQSEASRLVRLQLEQGPDSLRERLVSGIEARVIGLLARPAGAAGQEQEQFEFMGLEGDISVYLDPQTGLPLRLVAELDGLGEVELDLKQVRMDRS